MEDEREQSALFEIEGPDEDGCVWISSIDEPHWHHNLGRPIRSRRCCRSGWRRSMMAKAIFLILRMSRGRAGWALLSSKGHHGRRPMSSN
jgi:hypothetical protein